MITIENIDELTRDIYKEQARDISRRCKETGQVPSFYHVQPLADLVTIPEREG